MLTKAENIPEELKRLSQWVCVSKNDKIPKNPFNGKNAKANDPKSWGTFEQAVKACESFGFDYIGFEFASPYFGVDLDQILLHIKPVGIKPTGCLGIKDPDFINGVNCNIDSLDSLHV